MSYTHLDARNDTNDLIVSALNSTDIDYIMKIARQVNEVGGWEEEAQMLVDYAKKLNRDDWAYDESIGN